MAAKGWKELVWSSDHDRTSLSRAAGRGTLARLSPGLYTSAVTDAPADVVRRNLHTIVAHELPGAVIADRSARHGGEPIDGDCTSFIAEIARWSYQAGRSCPAGVRPVSTATSRWPVACSSPPRHAPCWSRYNDPAVGAFRVTRSKDGSTSCAPAAAVGASTRSATWPERSPPRCAAMQRSTPSTR